MAEAESGIPVERETDQPDGHQQSDVHLTRQSDAKATAVHNLLLNLERPKQFKRWPPYATMTDVMRCPRMLGSKIFTEQRQRRSKSEKSRWEVVLEAAAKAPELLFVDEQQERAYFLPIDPVAYDTAFRELGLKDWTQDFCLRDV